MAPQMPQERAEEVGHIDGLEVARLEAEVEAQVRAFRGYGERGPLGAFHLVNLYTNALDRCFTWRYSGAHTMEDDALWQ